MKKDFWDRSHTTVRFPDARFRLSPDWHVTFFGSCFAGEIGLRYRELGLPCSYSPYGIIYNPVTLAESLENLMEKKLPGDPFFQQKIWRHFAFHSSNCYRGTEENRDEAFDHFSGLIHKGHETLIKTDCLIITLGTAWVYRHNKSERIVNNCHRCDNRDFTRACYTDFLRKDREHPLLSALNQLKERNPGLHVIITLSPIRHLRDDARENSYSKALLRCLCEDISRGREWIEYFPAYEIVMDELRDYRWYGEDLTHLSQAAVSYILERFFNWAGDEKLLSYVADRDKILRKEKHRPLS